MAANAKEILDRYNKSEGKKQKYQFSLHYQIIAEYFQTTKADFTTNFQPGVFLNRDLFDSTGPKSANIMAGALLGMLWPEGAKNFVLTLARNIPDTKINRDFINEQSHRLLTEMNHPEAGLALALNEGMRDGVVFGTDGIGVFNAPERENYECFFLFQPWDVKRMTIEEGPNGLVNRVWYELDYTLDKLVQAFGRDAISKKSRDSYDKGNYSDKVTVLHAIEPRYNRNLDGASSFDMPVSSVFIETESTAGLAAGTGASDGTVLKESGFESMRVFVSRFYKNIRELYGRSPAMAALPDVLELNSLREAEIIATEKLLDPPLAVLDDGRLGASVIDTSAGAINTFNVSGRINGNQPPVIQLQTIQDIKSTKDRIEELKQSVADHFMVDHLLDFNNETEMTLGEVNIREKFRARLLTGLLSRQTIEKYSPMVKCCYNMMLSAGRLGVMPNSIQHFNAVVSGQPVLVIPADIAAAMLRGEHVYDIKYLTPAMRMAQSENLGGILNTWKFANDLAQAQPEVYDGLDEDMSLQLVAEYAGAPDLILRAKDIIKQIRDARAQEMQKDKQFKQKIELMTAAGKLKGLAPQQGAPGVQADPQMSEPLAV